jgi:hypothetical protein
MATLVPPPSAQVLSPLARAAVVINTGVVLTDQVDGAKVDRPPFEDWILKLVRLGREQIMTSAFFGAKLKYLHPLL